MKVEILSGCICCGMCESVNSEVFELNTIAHVNEENIPGNEDDIYKAQALCPVNVIVIEED